MKIINTKTLHSTPFLNLEETTYKDQNGDLKHWNWARRPNDTQAVIIAAIVGDRFVVIRQFRVPLGDYVYELPAGLIDPGESPIEAGKREFSEETGFVISRVVGLSPALYSSPGLTNESAYILYAEAERATSNIKEHGNSEEIEILLLNKSEIRKLLDNHDIKIDGKAYLVLKTYILLYSLQE
jgi:ADP-ribose pyrophosphatase